MLRFSDAIASSSSWLWDLTLMLNMMNHKIRVIQKHGKTYENYEDYYEHDEKDWIMNI